MLVSCRRRKGCVGEKNNCLERLAIRHGLRKRLAALVVGQRSYALSGVTKVEQHEDLLVLRQAEALLGGLLSVAAWLLGQ